MLVYYAIYWIVAFSASSHNFHVVKFNIGLCLNVDDVDVIL